MKELSGLKLVLVVDNGLLWRETGLALKVVRPGTGRVHQVFSAGYFDCEVVSSAWDCPLQEPRERIPVNWQFNDRLSPRQCKSFYSSSVNTRPMKEPVRTHLNISGLNKKE